MFSYTETKDSLLLTAPSMNVEAGSFIQLRFRPKKGTITKVVNNGTEYFIKPNDVSPKFDGQTIVYKDSLESEVYIERHIYTLDSGLDIDESFVISKTNPITGGVGFNVGGICYLDFSGNGVEDQIKINDALLNYKTVIISGTAAISAPVIMNSNNRIEFKEGGGLKIRDDITSGFQMVTNRSAITEQRSISDAAIASGSYTLTAASITPDDAGRSVIIFGAAASGLQLNALIVSATAGSATLNIPAVTSVSSKTARFFDRDVNISIYGGIINRNNSVTIDGPDVYGHKPKEHCLVFRRVDGLVFKDMSVKSKGGKYAFSVGDCTRVRNIRPYYEVSSDGFHIQGPASDIRVYGSRGTTHDDPIAITCCDYTAYNDCMGSVSDVVFKDTKMSNHGGRILLTGGPGCTIRGVRVDGLTGLSKAAGVAIPDGNEAGFPVMFVTDIDDVVLSNINPKLPDGYHGIYIGATAAKTITIRDHVWDIGSAGGANIQINGNVKSLIMIASKKPLSNTTSTQYGVFVGSTAVVDNMKISGLDVQNITGSYIVTSNVRIDGWVKSLQITNYSTVNETYSVAGNTLLLVNTGGKIDFLQIDGLVEINAKHSINVASGATVGPISYSNFQRVNCARIAEFASAGDISIGVGVNSAPQAEAVRANGAAVIIRGGGCLTNTSGYDGVLRVGSESVRVINTDFPADTAKLTPQAGDRCWNRNAASAPGVVGPAIYNGTAWKSLLLP